MPGQPKGKKWKKVRDRIKKLTPKILKMRKDGKTHEEIGRHFGIKKGTIQVICVRHSVVPVSPGRGRVHCKKGHRGTLYPEIIRLRELGFKGSEIARKLGLKDAKEVKDIVKYWRTDVPVLRLHTKESIEEQARDFIRKVGRYVGGRELCKDLGISSSSFMRHGVSVPVVNEKEGFKSPFSVFQDLVGGFLRELFHRVLNEQKFDGCLSPKGFSLRFDFYVPDVNLLVEADGVQHDYASYNDTSYFTSAEYRAACDKIKDAFARSQGIKLVRIPYVGKVTRDYVRGALESSGVHIPPEGGEV